MDLASSEQTTTVSKCLVLIERLVAELSQLDPWHFPTESSTTAQHLLINVLNKIREPKNLAPIDSSVLYNRIFSLQALAETVTQSSTDRISWPVVSHCDAIWGRFFGSAHPRIFYSVTGDHNYKLLRFSEEVSIQVRDVLPSRAIQGVIGNETVYCLLLASTENENLPLYANIGHEFGHAIHDHKKSDLLPALQVRLASILPVLRSDLKGIDAQSGNRRFDMVVIALLNMAKEVFCDVVGGILMGPAFFLSAYEMSWGQDRNVCRIQLSPRGHLIKAYPSFHFRLQCIRRAAQIDEFSADAKREFAVLTSPRLAGLADCLSTIPTTHASDRLKVSPVSDADAISIEQALLPHLNEIKKALDGYAVDCESLMKEWFRVTDPCVTAHDVAELLLRLDHDILPNIVPDGTLLGTPATFNAVLTASALFQMGLLVRSSCDQQGELSRQVGIVQRLMSKALEVSFVQRKYNERARD